WIRVLWNSPPDVGVDVSLYPRPEDGADDDVEDQHQEQLEHPVGGVPEERPERLVLHQLVLTMVPSSSTLRFLGVLIFSLFAFLGSAGLYLSSSPLFRPPCFFSFSATAHHPPTVLGDEESVGPP